MTRQTRQDFAKQKSVFAYKFNQVLLDKVLKNLHHLESLKADNDLIDKRIYKGITNNTQKLEFLIKSFFNNQEFSEKKEELIRFFFFSPSFFDI